MRRKHRENRGFTKSMMELHYYRPAIFKFIGAIVYHKDLLHEADLGPDSVVVDVGAFTGAWAQFFIDKYNPTIHAFEPNPDSFAELQERTAKHPKLKPYCYGLGGEDSTVEFTLNGLGSSMCDERSKSTDLPRMSVEIAAVDRIWEELALGNVDLMKINIEGAEFPLLETMIRADLFKQVDCFMIQFHEWAPAAHWKRWKIRRELAKTHDLIWNHHFVWEKWERRTPAA